MKDRARALLSLVEADRNRLYGAHRIFLRQLCKVFPDIEAEQRAKVTEAARALLGKKGPMVHQVFVEQEPSVEQDLDIVGEEGVAPPVDYKSCLKGIAKRLIYHQSNPSNGNVSMLIGHSTSVALLDATLRVMAAQRWHLRAGHEPLSLQFMTTTIKRWPTEEPDWAEKLGDFLEKAVSRESNHACLLTPKVLIASLQAIGHRVAMSPAEAEIQWRWLSVAVQMFSTAKAYCGSFFEMEDKILAAYLSLFSTAAKRSVDNAFTVPGTEQKFSEFLTHLIDTTLTPSAIAIVSDFVLADALRIHIHNKKQHPEAVLPRIGNQESLLHLYSAYRDGAIDLAHLESIQVPSVPQGPFNELRAFLSGSVQTA